MKSVPMGIGRRIRGRLVVIAWVMMLWALTAGGPASGQSPFGCDTPISQRPSEVGCYFTASEVLGALTQGQVFWHLYHYPTRAAAEAARGPHGTVVESFGKVWLYTIAEEGWQPSGGTRVAVIGPLTITPGKQYTARYMEAVFTPGMKTRIHRHSGAEAWYVLAGTQCLETPKGITVAHAGEGAVVPQGPPMILQTVGSETRRSVLLVLHESPEPWSTLASDWKPKGLCPE
jgi:quercetin dioxygenase-like cupin family protein